MKTVFENENIGIRPYQESDLQAFYDAAKESEGHVAPFLPWIHENYSPEDAKEWIYSRNTAWESKQAYSFAIYSLNDGKYIGDISLNQMNWTHLIGNMGYWIRKSDLGKNYASQAGKLISIFGFEELKLNRIEIVVSAKNSHSIKIAENLGIKECLAKNRLYVNNERIDAFVFAVLPENT